MAKLAKNGNVAGKGRIGGRAKGTPNKITQTVKQAIEAAAEGLGGTARLIAWANEDPANERIFWGNIYPKLLPLQLTGEGGGPIVLELSNADARL
jgi:hypothetical protein